MSVVTREVLRSHPDLLEEYEALKRTLAAETEDIGTYSRGENTFIERTLDIARRDSNLAFDFTVPETSP